MRFKQLSIHIAKRIFLFSLAVIASQIYALFFLGFQPGWANGWPGLSKHSVFAGFVTVTLFVALLSGATGILALVGSVIERVVGKRYVGWASFAILLSVASVVILAVCTQAFPVFRASIAREWP
jgi:hypothetical protein